MNARDHTILECLGYWSGPGGGDAAHMIGLAFDAGVRAEAERRDKIERDARASKVTTNEMQAELAKGTT